MGLMLVSRAYRANVARITAPTLLVHTGRDREIDGGRRAPHVEALMDAVVPRIEERLA